MEGYSYLVLALIFASAQGLPLFLRNRLGRHGLLGAPAVDRVREPPVQWLTQRLDHFDKRDDRTWQQRYWVNDSFWDRRNGPVFLMIAGEAEASWKWVVSGEMMTNAKKFRALAVQLEHRSVLVGPCLPMGVGTAQDAQPFSLRAFFPLYSTSI